MPILRFDEFFHFVRRQNDVLCIKYLANTGGESFQVAFDRRSKRFRA